MRTTTIAAGLLLGAWLGLARPAAAAGPSLAECDAGLREDSESRERWGCYYEAARAGVALADAEARLRAAIERHPGEHGYDLLTLANLVAPRDPDAGIGLYERALAVFEARGDDLAMVLTALNLAQRRRVAGEAEAAADALVVAERAAVRHGEDRWIATVKGERVRHMLRTGDDFGAALRLLAEIEPLLFPDGAYQAQINWLNSAGTANAGLGRVDVAEGYYDRLIAITQAHEDGYAEANARYNRALRALARAQEAGDEGSSPALLAELVAIEAVAEASENAYIETAARCLAAELRRDSAGLRACFDAAAAGDDPRILSEAAIAYAWVLARSVTDPIADADAQEALTRVAEARVAVEAADDLEILGRLLGAEAELRWWLGREPEARAASEALITHIESRRLSLGGREDRARYYGRWSDAYERYIGHLLGGGPAQGRPAGASDGDRVAAFEVSERLRAQELLAAVGGAGIGEASTLRREPEYRQVLADLAAVQIRLADPELSGDAREQAITELERLERREQGLQAEQADSRAAIEIASLAETQAALGPDEALLVFQLADADPRPNHWNGGSWVFVLTRAGLQVHPLPSERELGAALAMFGSLLARRDGGELEAGARLWRALLGEALAQLPEGIERLIVVPDGPLHRLPFAALRPDAAAPALAERYALSHAPSATALVLWRRDRGGPLPASVLALADPVVTSEPARLFASAIAAPERGGSLVEGLRLVELPRARIEGERAVVGGGELWVGEQAGEAALRGRDLSEFGVVHFATHALVDEIHPSRSAIVLARDDEQLDGLLQPRDIVELELDGKLVVLSACSSASGAVLDGEGVMGLAHAMFEAGAHAVVGSLWPIRDDDALALFDRFYAHLDAGLPVAAALAAAQRERMAEGAPPAAWAGVVVLGDGSLTLTPRALAHEPEPATGEGRGLVRGLGWALGGLGIAGLGLLLLSDARRRRA